MTKAEFHRYLAGLAFTAPVEMTDLEDLRARLRVKVAAGATIEVILRDDHVEVSVGVTDRQRDYGRVRIC